MTKYDIERAVHWDAFSQNNDYGDNLEAWVGADKRLWPTPDVGMLRKTADWVREQDALRQEGKPSEWDQSVYFSSSTYCGTSCCVAGWLGLNFTDYTPTLVSLFDPATGDSHAYEAMTATLLGLSELEADWLTDEHNELTDIEIIIDLAMQRAGDRL